MAGRRLLKLKKILPRRFGRIDIRLLWPFIIGAFAALFAVAIIALISADALRRQAAELQIGVIRSVKDQLEQDVEQFQNDVRALADAVPLVKGDEEAERSLLKSGVSPRSPWIFEVSIVDSNGRERVKAVRGRPRPNNFEDYSDDIAFHTALDGETYLSPVYIQFGQPFLDMTVPVRDEMGVTLSVLRAEIDLSAIWQLVSISEIGKQGYVYVVDSSRNLLAYREVEQIRDNHPLILDLPQIEEAIVSKRPLANAQEFSTGLQGVPVLVFYLPLEPAPDVEAVDWFVVAERPLSDAYAEANVFGLISAAFGIVTVVAILVMGLFIRRRIALPLRALRRGASALAKGNLAHRIHVDTGDELEFLAREFNDMASTLEKSQVQLASLVRERSQQAEDAQERLREMTTLIQSGRAITSLDLGDVLTRLSHEVALAVRGDRCSIYVRDVRQRRLILRGEWESQNGTVVNQPTLAQEPQTPVYFEWGQGVVGWVARESKPIFLTSAQSDKRFVPIAENDNDIAALIGVPLRIDDDVVGVMQATTRPGTIAFDPADRSLLTTFAKQAVIAIENSYLYEAERRRAQEMSIVAEITRTISASLDLETTLDSILSSIRELISYDLAEITLWESDQRLLRTVGRGADPQYAEYSRNVGGAYTVGEGFTGWIASHRAPLLVTDIDNSEIAPALDRERFPICSMVGVPLLAFDQLVGTLELASYTTDAFSEAHQETLRIIAAQAAITIRNSQLYAESRSRADELAGMFRIASIAASVLEPIEILRQIMEETATLMNAQLGIVLLLNLETKMLEAHPTALFGGTYEQVADFRIDTQLSSFEQSVFNTGSTFRSDNVPNDPRILEAYRPFHERFGVSRLVSAPLIVRDKHIGEVHVVRTEGKPFVEKDEQRLLTLGTLLAGVVEEADLARKHDERLRELTGLYEISQALSALTDARQVYSQITKTIAEQIGVQFAGVMLYDHNREMLVSQAPFYGVPDEVLEHYNISVQSGSEAHRIWTENDVWISNDVQNDPLTRDAGLDELAATVGVKRTLMAAMVFGTSRVGVIQVSNKLDDKVFDENDARLMSIYAAQITLVVENARLYMLTDVQLQQRVEELTSLSAISQELNATLELERILDLVLDEAVRATGTTFGSIILTDRDTGELVLRAVRGYNAEDVERIRIMPLNVGEGVIGKVVETGEPMLVNNTREHADYVKVSETTQAELAVPIRYALEVVGVINLESVHTDHFTGDHIAFLQALASQAAIAIGNAQRYEEQMLRGELLRRRAEQLANLFEIGQAFRSDRPLVEVLDDVVHAVQETTGFRIAMISLLQGDPPVLERVAAAGLPVSVFEEMKKVRQPWESVNAVLSDVFRISQSYYIPMEHRNIARDLHTWPLTEERDVVSRESDKWHEEDLLITPLRGSTDRILGILSVDQPYDERVPQRSVIETLELFTNQAAIAIENARLLEDLQQRIDSLTLFNEVSRTISARLDLDGLLTTIVSAGIELVACRSTTIYLRDFNSGRFVARKARGYDLALLDGKTWAEGEGLVGTVARDGRALIIPDVKTDARFVPDLADESIAATMLVPISVGGQIIGVLQVDKATPRSFSNTDLLMLSTLADQAAIAIENAQLFGQTVSRSRELSTLFEAATAITSNLALDSVLDAVGQQLVRALNVQTVTVTRWKRALNQVVVMVNRDTRSEQQTDKPGKVFDLATYPGAVQMLEDGTPQALRVGDASSSELDRINLERAGFKALLRLPLAVQDRVIGMVELGERERDRSFTESEIQLAQTLTNQAAIAIANAELFAETQKRVAELETINTVGQAISASMPLIELVELIRREVNHVIDASDFYIALYDAKTNLISFPIFYDHNERITPEPIAGNTGITGYVLNTRRPLLLNSPSDLTAIGLENHYGDVPQSFIGVPLIIGEFVSGVMAVQDYTHLYAYDEGHVRILSTIATQAAIAIENARLFDEVRNFAQELEDRVHQRTDELAMANAELTLERDRVETLYRITSELSASLDLDRVLNRALALVNEAVGTTRGSILLIDGESSMLIHRAALGLDKALPVGGERTRFSSSEGLAGWVIQNRLPAIVPELRRDDRWDEQPDHEERLYQSAMVTPLIAGEDVLGALLLLHTDMDYFADAHLRLVETAASQVATAINNAALYGFIRESAERLGMMLRAQQIEGAKFQAILESVTDAVLVADADEKIILFNAAAERILGYERDTVLGRVVSDFAGLYGPLGAEWEDQIRKWRQDPQARREVPLLSNLFEFEADKRHVNVTIAPVTGPSEEYIGTVSVFRDISAEVQADRAKTDFVSNVSHELRTPMTSIKGYADLLLIGAAGNLNENQDRFLNIIKANADRLTTLVDDLLNISRIETGSIELDFKKVDMNNVIEQVVESLRERIEQKELHIEAALPDEDSVHVFGDRDRLIQILTNLVSNAYQYTNPGGTIRVVAQIVDGMMRVDVQDSGIGIPEEDADKVFQRFFRADDPLVQEFSGTGLGLSIVESLVKMHGGDIWFESQMGEGTTFSFTVPLATEELTIDATVDEVAVKTASRFMRESAPHILVVEDDPDIAALLVRQLEEVGYRVSSVSTGKDALDVARAEKPDLITLDIFLPDIDGLRVLNELKEDPETADVPVVMVSVMPDNKESLEMGAIDYITKPINLPLLIEVVSRVLGQVGTVLVVEDHRDTRRLLTEALQRAGFRVLVTASGRQGLQLAKDENPDLILLDVKLPRMDGYTVLQNLRKSKVTSKTPVMIMTGSVILDEARRKQFKSLGAADIVLKPFDVASLISKIEKLLASDEDAPTHSEEETP